jgi:hypothetical protein
MLFWLWLYQNEHGLWHGGKCCSNDVQKWHHIGSQTLIYVERAHNPTTFSLANALEDDKSTFEAYTDSTPQ